MPQPQVPGWVPDAIFYQIFPDRFASSASVTKPRNLEAWDAPPTLHGFKGGDLVGVIERLDYLQDVGITAVYLNPIFQSPSNHRYHTHDYYQVDPLLGGNAAFYRLRDELHRRGMRLMLDGVFNHASRGNFYFSDILENGLGSPWIDWFTIYDWPLHAYDEAGPANYACWWNLRELPRWNSDHPDVREYLMRVGEHWVREGIDGWRLDVPKEITAPGFWQEFRQRVRAINPATYIVGEVWGAASEALRGDQYDGVMNYLFAECVIQFAGQEHIRPELVEHMGYHPYPAIDAQQYAAKIADLLALNAWETNLGQYNLLDSHDTARLRTIFAEDEAGVRLATLLLCTFPGPPSIYYGDEIGLRGGREPESRGTFPWDQPDAWNRQALAYHQQFIRLRRDLPALRTGSYRRVWPSPGDTSEAARAIYAFAREAAGEAIIVAANSSTASHTIALPLADLPTGAPTMLLGDPAWLARQGEHLTITLPPRDGCVVRFQG
jgi:glycosidase